MTQSKRATLAVFTLLGVFNALAIPVQLAAGNLGWARIDTVTAAVMAAVAVLAATKPARAA